MKNEIEKLVREAGKILLCRHANHIETKEGHANFVTDVDVAVQELLSRRLAEIVPGSRFIGEETDNELLTDAPTWVVDPLDGTSNFIFDYKQSSISIGLCENKRPVFGCVYNPYLDEVYFAERGKGAFRNGQPIHVSDRALKVSLVGFGTSPYVAKYVKSTMVIAGDFLQNCVDIRRTGSAAIDLANLGSGRIGAFFEFSLKPWDYCAGSLLIEEAGGIFTMPLLSERDYGVTTGVLAASPSCFEEAKAIFDAHWEDIPQ